MVWNRKLVSRIKLIINLSVSLCFALFANHRPIVLVVVEGHIICAVAVSLVALLAVSFEHSSAFGQVRLEFTGRARLSGPVMAVW